MRMTPSFISSLFIFPPWPLYPEAPICTSFYLSVAVLTACVLGARYVFVPGCTGYAARIGQYAERDCVLVEILHRLGAVPFVKTNVPQTLMVSFGLSLPPKCVC